MTPQMDGFIFSKICYILGDELWATYFYQNLSIFVM